MSTARSWEAVKMAVKLNGGDYFIRPGGTVRLQGSDAVFADALFRLQCVRGSFPFLPALGSRLWRLGLDRPADRPMLARQYCAEALEGTGVDASEVEVRLLDNVLTVAVLLTAGERSENVEVSV